MPDYHVSYEVDSDDADSPVDAAWYVANQLFEGYAVRAIYTVIDKATGETVTVDLEQEDPAFD